MQKSQQEISDGPRKLVRNAFDEEGLAVFSEKASKYIRSKKWKWIEVKDSIKKHFDSGFLVFVKLYDSSRSASRDKSNNSPNLGYHFSLCHHIDVQEAYRNLNLTHYTEIKSKTKFNAQSPFMINMHDHYGVSILPFKR